MVVTIGRKPPLASANPVTTPVPSATGGRAHRRGHAGGADRDEHVAGLRAPCRGRHPCCRRCRRPRRRRPASAPATAPGATSRGSATAWPRACSARSGRQAPVAGGEVAGAGGVAAVGERRRCRARSGGGETKSWGSSTRRTRAAALGLVVAQPAQLGGGEGGDQDAADRVRAGLRSAHLGDEVAGGPGRPGVVPQQGVADRRRRPRRGRPCRAAGPPTATASARSSRPSVAVVDGAQPGPRVDLGAGRVGRRTGSRRRVPSSASTRSALVDWVEESMPRTRATSLLSTSLELMSRRSCERLWRSRAPDAFTCSG